MQGIPWSEKRRIVGTDIRIQAARADQEEKI